MSSKHSQNEKGFFTKICEVLFSKNHNFDIKNQSYEKIEEEAEYLRAAAVKITERLESQRNRSKERIKKGDEQNE